MCEFIKPSYNELSFDLSGSEERFSLINSVMSEMIKKIYKIREDQIIERLKIFGFAFESREELEDFARNRLSLVTHEEDPTHKHLYIDFNSDTKILVAHWHDTVESEFEPSSNKWTMIVGR